MCTGGLALLVYAKDFILTTDFGYFGLDGVVPLVIDSVESPVLFVSRVLSKI